MNINQLDKLKLKPRGCQPTFFRLIETADSYQLILLRK